MIRKAEMINRAEIIRKAEMISRTEVFRRAKYSAELLKKQESTEK